MNDSSSKTSQRRGFLKKFLSGAAVLGAGMIAKPSVVSAAERIVSPDISEADEWFKKVKGRHKMVFDVTEPHGIFPFAWPRVFLMTNAKTGTPPDDCGVVVVFRHSSVIYAMNNQLWEKYKFGEFLKIGDTETKAPAIHNPFWEPKPGTYKGTGGELLIGINQLQQSGVMFCVCDMALTGLSATIAEKNKQNADEVKKEWLNGLLPGVQLVPSGVWAVGRAQERGCAYCFAS